MGVSGVDNVLRALRRARERAREAGVEIRVVDGDVTALGPADIGSSFGLLLDFGLFHDELTDEQRQTMGREVRAVASPGVTMLMNRGGDTRRADPIGGR